MIRIDCHIHSNVEDAEIDDVMPHITPGGFDGGIIFSQNPNGMEFSFSKKSYKSEERINAVLKITSVNKYLFPFFWINPTEPDALEQVELAESKGIVGYKVICSSHFPCDERAIPVYKKIASLNRPVLFHSGILYDGRNASGNYNRPCNFEGLLSIDNLRFALAHASWPWTDECIAVFGKFNSARGYKRDSGSTVGEIFIDLTPGPPKLYRKPLFDRLLFSIGDVKNNIIYGIDGSIGSKDMHRYAKEILDYDESVFDEYFKSGGPFGERLDDDFKDCLYHKNVLRFIGLPENY